MIETALRICSVDETRLCDGLQGIYVCDHDLIILDDRLCAVQRRCVLAHEISHARHRDSGCRHDRWVERRADMEAAMMLVDPLEYAYAETVYDGNLYGMARELDVLPWVVDAYRERLHDDPGLVVR